MLGILILSVLAALLALVIMAMQEIGPFAPVPVVTPPPPPPPPPPPGVEKLDISASGLEVFSSTLEPARLYRLIFQGTCHLLGEGIFGSLFGTDLDAAYAADSSRNFSKSHDWVVADGLPIRQLDCFQEDRALHLYTAWFEGSGKRVSFRIVGGTYDSTGTLTVTIEPLPRNTASPSAAKSAEAQKKAQAEAAQRQAEAIRKQQEEEQQRTAARERQIFEFQRHVRQNRNFLDGEFRREYIRKNHRALLTNLRSEWTREYNTVFDDADLVARLKAAAPEVLEWYECRLDMILEAERLETVPEKPPAPPPPAPPPPPRPPNRQITASTMGHVSQCIRELFQFTEQYDRERQAQALDKNEAAHEPKLARAIAGMAFQYKELRRFGIDADSPEAAEMQFFEMCPPPAPTYYEELIQKLKKRKAVPPDALGERLDDLHEEKIIWQAKRRACIRQDDQQQRDKIDRRLSDVRREATEIQAFLVSIKVPVEFKDRREQEVSLEEQFIRLYSGKKRVIDFLISQGDQQMVEQVEVLYAQEQAKLFEQDSSYT